MRRSPPRWRSERSLLSPSAPRMAVCISGSIIVLAKLEALRGPGESYSEVILRLAAERWAGRRRLPSVGFLRAWRGSWDGGAKRRCDARAASPGGSASIGSADRRNNRNNRTRNYRSFHLPQAFHNSQIVVHFCPAVERDASVLSNGWCSIWRIPPFGTDRCDHPWH
jgi:hypothetical protein